MTIFANHQFYKHLQFVELTLFYKLKKTLWDSVSSVVKQ